MGRLLRRICQIRSASLQQLPTAGLRRLCGSSDGVPSGARLGLRLHCPCRIRRASGSHDDPAAGNGSDNAGRAGASHDISRCHAICAANHLPDAIPLFHTAIHNGVYGANLFGRRVSGNDLQCGAGPCLFAAHASVSSQHCVASAFGRIHGRSRIPDSIVDGSRHSEFILRRDAGPRRLIRRNTSIRTHVSGIDSLVATIS